jgi:hypothetical protein
MYVVKDASVVVKDAWRMHARQCGGGRSRSCPGPFGHESDGEGPGPGSAPSRPVRALRKLLHASFHSSSVRPSFRSLPSRILQHTLHASFVKGVNERCGSARPRRVRVCQTVRRGPKAAELPRRRGARHGRGSDSRAPHSGGRGATRPRETTEPRPGRSPSSACDTDPTP